MVPIVHGLMKHSDDNYQTILFHFVDDQVSPNREAQNTFNHFVSISTQVGIYRQAVKHALYTRQILDTSFTPPTQLGEPANFKKIGIGSRSDVIPGQLPNSASSSLFRPSNEKLSSIPDATPSSIAARIAAILNSRSWCRRKHSRISSLAVR